MNRLFNIHLDSFEGPLDLLYHLIEKNKIDIYDIPIAEITDQYLQYINEFQAKNMDSMSEFMLLAATLLEIKSKMLLPISKKEETAQQDPREELVSRLIEYKRYKAVSIKLKDCVNENKYIYKEPDYKIVQLLSGRRSDNIEEILCDITMEKLFMTFEEALKRRESKTDKIRGSFNAVSKEEYTLDDKIRHIRLLLEKGKIISFLGMLKEAKPKAEKIAIFLAVLELIKMREIEITQDTDFADICIILKEE